MKKLHVAFCLRDMQLGGVESVLIRTLDKLSEYKDIDISVITYVNVKEPIFVDYFKKHSEIKVRVLYPCSWLSTKLPHFFVWRFFVHLLRDIYRNTKRVFIKRHFKNIDVFIDYHDFGFYREFKHIKNSKKLAWFHSSINVFIKRNFIKKINNYDKVVVLTDEFMDCFNEIYSEQNDKLTRIYNPIDIADIKNKANEKIKAIKGKYFCSVSRLAGDKDIKTLLNGFDLFWNMDNQPDVKLIIIGDGGKKSEYESYAKNLKSSKQIIFVGAQKNPFAYMKNACANILSSLGEGLPTVMIESAVVETLNVASACQCGPREIVLNGRGGMLFEPGNADDLARCLTNVYNNNINIKQMINESIKALNRFDSDKIVKQIICLIS